MWTLAYKGYYIHGCYDKPEVIVLFPPPHYDLIKKKSLHAAKLFITKDIEKHGTPYSQR